MKCQKKQIANWGNFPKTTATVWQPETIADISETIVKNKAITMRGAGKCYGDAALGETIVSMLSLNKILHFDPKTGIIDCQSGVLLQDIITQTVPKGWFLHVTPGIKSITVGGAVASDVHGKNHQTKGCFSNFLLDFDLMMGNGETIFCSKTENEKLFWQTCGGMGWTGAILRARFELMPVQTPFMRQKTLRCATLADIFQSIERQTDWGYSAAWMDLDHPKGRGVVFFADHLKAGGKYPDSMQKFSQNQKPLLNIPFFAPSWLLNRFSMEAYNWFFYKKNREKTGIVSIDQYFYPLDSIGNWNRLYGRRGFVQYQCLFPLQNAVQTCRTLQELIRQSPHRPFLTVLKKHGPRPEKAVHSFPDAGYSLAMDFKWHPKIKNFIHQLDDLVWAVGGKVYLAKDSLSKEKMGRIDPQQFGEKCFTSQQKERITQNRFGL